MVDSKRLGASFSRVNHLAVLPRDADTGVCNIANDATKLRDSLLSSEISKMVRIKFQQQVSGTAQNALISPIQRLPAELMSAIFEV
jgi:hypothetical protein